MDKHNLLHPPLHVKNLKNKEEALLIDETGNGNFAVVFLNARFKALRKRMDVPAKDLSTFLDSTACQNLKAVLFLLDNDDYLVSNLETRQMVYEKARKRKWHIYLVDLKTLHIISMLFASKIDSKPGDVILSVSSMDQMDNVSVLRRKPEGYSYISFQMINRFNRNINDVATEILGTCIPKYVTVCDPEGNDLLMSLKSLVVPPEKVINIDRKCMLEYRQQVFKTIFNHGYNQLIPFSMDILAVTNESSVNDAKEAVISVEKFEELPFEKVKIVSKSKKPYCVAYFDNGSYKHAGKAQLPKKQRGHRIKLSLVVDRNSLPFLYQEPFIIPEIGALPQKLASSKADLNVPVISFYDNSSVICVSNENGYMFLNEWNGLYGNDLYLTFEPQVPTIVTDLNKVKDKDPFVIYDLIKILSMPPNHLKADPNWGFEVTSDAQNPVLLKYDTFFGIRKVATPVFLMALILKHHVKAIKKETGKRPKQLGFCIFNQFTKKEKKRIKTGLEEACKLLKIGFIIV